MKGKAKYISRLFLIVAVLMTACVCVIGIIGKQPDTIYAAYTTTLKGENFSHVDEDNVIMSVEKVAVASTGSFVDELKTSSGTSFKTMRDVDGKSIYYSDLAGDNGEKKNVVYDNKFVMLNNKKEDGVYKTTSSVTAKNSSGAIVNVQEAIMISIGQYVWDGADIVKSTMLDKNVSVVTRIAYQSLRVYTLDNDGIETPTRLDLPNASTYNKPITSGQTITGQDFVFVLTQDNASEGYYEFKASYFYNGYQKNISFGFYLLFQDSYSGNLQVGEHDYSKDPRLTLGKEDMTPLEGTYHYSLGVQTGDETEYPVLTYDYTKYDLYYTHTANGVVTEYYNRLGTKAEGGNAIISDITTSNGKSTKYHSLEHYLPSTNTSLVSMVLTEMGVYNFDFKYVYRGARAKDAPEINLTRSPINLYIHGFELKYSKDGFSEAQMRYLTLSAKDAVDIIVPNGYLSSELPKDKALGVMYGYDENSTERVGAVVKTEDAQVSDFVNSLPASYVKTNQGPLWLATNDSFEIGPDADPESYYYHSYNKFTSVPGVDKKNKLTNSTSFTKVGYYLVAVKVKASNYVVGSSPYTYMQYFAFQYVANSIDMKMEVLDLTSGDVLREIGSDGYTNQNVRISWTEPGVFERGISAKYYTKGDFSDKASLFNSQSRELKNGNLGGNNGLLEQEGSYLIEVKSEGVTATYTMFTIDRQAIEDVKAYAVDTINVGKSKAYTFARDKNGNHITLSGITNGLSTLFWGDKESGADINVSYSFTPIVKDLSVSVRMMEVSEEKWITTNYILGNTEGGYQIEKASSINGDVDYKYVLYNQGVYIFTLTDEAGNSAKYALIIDNTEAYFKVTSNGKVDYISGVSYKSPNDVNVDAGTHKAIKINESASAGDPDAEEFSRFIKYADYRSLGYLNGDKISEYIGYNGEYFIKVEHTSVNPYKYSSGNTKAEDVEVSSFSCTVKLEENGLSNSTVRRLYLLGANQLNVTATESKSYILVEINTDNSQGTVHASNEKETFYDATGKLTLSNLSRARELYTGSSIGGAEATSDTYVAFTWKTGRTSENYSVKRITMSYYKLKLDTGIFDNKYYYYDETVGLYTVKDLYYSDATKTTIDSSVIFDDNNDNGMAIINVSNNQTLAGLYVITREYVGDGGDADGKIRNYWFIVDRNGIITNEDINGGKINIGLLDSETEYKNFSTIGGNSATFSYTDKNPSKSIADLTYSINLSTNKVPVVLNVPLYKYFNELDTSSNYGGVDAGGLNIALYYHDVYAQLSSTTGTTIKLFDSTDERFTFDNNDGHFSFSIVQKGNPDLTTDYIRRFTNDYKINEGSYICLPGNYILIIRDKVKSGDRDYSTEKIVGFQITYSQPHTEVISVANEGDTTSSKVVDNKTLKLTTNDQYIRVNIDPYNDNNTKAQIDPDYLVVSNVTNKKDVVLYEYGNTGTDVMEPTKNADGIITLVIDTTDAKYGNTDIYVPLEYKITIRYRLWKATNRPNSGDSAPYENCYYYIDNSKAVAEYNDCYETTYTIIIDRQAPITNVKNLQAEDSLVRDSASLFENYEYVFGTGKTYTYRYEKYEGNNHLGAEDIYAFVVDKDTDFSATDITTVYWNEIGTDTLSSLELELPVTTKPNTFKRIYDTDNKYGKIGLTEGVYYEILEEDAAGNITQYVIYYVESIEDAVTSDNFSLSLIDGNVIDGGNKSVSETDPHKFTAGGIHTLVVTDNSDTFTMKAEINGDHKFYRIEIDGTNIDEAKIINTNLTTTSNLIAIAEEIAGAVSGRGNYTITVITREDSYTFTLSCLAYDASVTLVVTKDNMIDNGDFYFGAANRWDEEKGYYINYAKKVTIVSQDTIAGAYEPDSDFKTYKKEDGTFTGESITLDVDTTYVITVTDAFDNTTSIRVNLSRENDEFKSIKFGYFDEDGVFVESAYTKIGDNYYSYHTVLLEYDSTVYDVSYDSATGGGHIEKKDNGKMKQLVITPYWGDDYKGGTINVTVRLITEGTVEDTYNIFVDTSTANVALMDVDGEPQDMIVDVNKTHTDTKSGNILSGTMNLTWNVVDKEYFNYSYILHREREDGSFEDIAMNTTHAIINVEDGYTGKYVFEVQVLNSDGLLMGNKLYTFMVKSALGQLYYVEVDGVAIGASDTFYFYDSENNWQLTGLPSEVEFVAGLKLTKTDDITRNEVYLYISNQEMLVKYSEAHVAGCEEYPVPLGNETVTFYRLYTNTYSVYLATLKVGKSTKILSKVELTVDGGTLLNNTDGSDRLNITSSVSYSISKAKLDDGKVKEIGDVKLSFNRYNKDANNNLLSKLNIITVDVWHNGAYVDTYEEFEIASGLSSLKIQGSGTFKFVFRDLAGNRQEFGTDDEKLGSELQITIMQEMIINIDDTIAIDNGYYNGNVTLSVWNPSQYDLGTVTLVSATRNGEPYTPEKSQYNYTFNHYGTYRVSFEAKYNNGLPISKTLIFTLVNEKEARESIDLSSIGNHTITSVKNADGKDITDNFLKIIYNNAVEYGMNLTFGTVLENHKALGITDDYIKQTFTVTYLVNDQMYPKRTITFAFTLNDIVPSIECSLKSGESTTKSVTFKFNAGIVYEEIGECDIYLNDRLLMSIDENSSSDPVELVISRGYYGAGNYYLKIMSKSGDVIDSYKIVLKDPLNASSIIVIIVVSAAAIGVVVTILVLRHRMRIR